MEAFLMWFLLFAIIYWFATRNDRRDRRRWPRLMKNEDYFHKKGSFVMRKYANEIRKKRKRARTDERLAEQLDRAEDGAWEAKWEADRQGEMDRMRSTMYEMDRKIKDLEYENMRNRRY